MRLLRAAVSAAALHAVRAQRADAYIRMSFPNKQGVELFDQAKFGLFVHWGPVSQWGTEISFPLVCTSFPCHSNGPGNNPITIHNVSELAAHRQAYRDLAKTFNPTAFDADALAELAYGAGFRYVTPTAVHCDGFSLYNTSSVNANYSMSVTPFGRDVTGELMTAFRAKGARAGIYICPSLWNNDDYFYPDSLTSFGDCCSPNYDVTSDPSMQPVWDRFVAYLHAIVSEINTAYKPDHWWFDSGTAPPHSDTHIELLVPAMRAANPNVVLHVRDGGVYHDYVESGDHSEITVDSIVGLTYAAVADKFEVPGTLGEQWAYDPRATYKTAPQVLQELIPIISKGGNYLMNIGLDSTGVWAPAAVVTLQNLTSWFAFAAESIHGTSPMWPYNYGDAWFAQSNSQPWSYISFWTGWNSSNIFLVPSYKPSLLKSLPTAIRRLTPTGPVDVEYTLDERGLALNVSDLPLASSVAFRTYYRLYSATVADRAPCGMRDCSVYAGDSYALEGVEGSCLTSAPSNGEPTVPVYLYYNGEQDNMGASAAPSDGQQWSDIDIECLAYVNNGSGRVPLEVWHSASLHDYWTLASNSSRATATAQGYALVSQVGFIDAAAPQPDPADVEAYAYVLRVEWQ